MLNNKSRRTMTHFSFRDHQPTMLRLLIISTIANYAVASKLDVIYEWKYIDYVWENEAHKNNAIAEGKYDHTQIFTIDAQKVPGTDSYKLSFTLSAFL